jgi:thiamine biosynthesis lipoprotein
MGTLFRVEFYAADSESAQAAVEAVWRRVHDLDEAFTDYKPESELMRWCRQPAGTRVKLSPDLGRILEQASEVTRRSAGAFDVTVGPLKRLWRQSRRDAVLPTPEQIAEARAVTGWDKVELFPDGSAVLRVQGMRLDLGGIAKGYAADAALWILKEHGLERALVAASGDVVAGEAPPGEPGWRVGVASLSDPDGRENAVRLRHQALSTSGDTMQSAEIDGTRYSHILDPKTGLGLTVRRMVNVIADSGALSDAWATALSLCGPEGATLPEEIAFRFEEAGASERVVRRGWPTEE